MADTIKKSRYPIAEIDAAIDLMLECYTRKEIDKMFDSRLAEISGDIAAETSKNRATLGFVKHNYLKNNAKTVTYSGINFTVNNDLSITINGTATGLAALAISAYQILPKGEYICSGCKGGSSNSYYIRYVSAKSAEQAVSTDVKRQYDDEVTITIDDEYDSIYANIAVIAGATVDNVTLYPMARRAEDEDDTYAQYIPDVFEYMQDTQARLAAIEAALTAATGALDESKI